MDELVTYNVSHEVTIKDLRVLGRQGGATAYLTDGQEMVLTPDHGLITRYGIVGGVKTTVKTIENYVSIYPLIRTIKRGNVLVARRQKVNGQSKLVLTGKGYHREKVYKITKL